jgi:hypothetical protein
MSGLGFALVARRSYQEDRAILALEIEEEVMQRKWSYEECKEELAYINSVNPAKPGKNFGNDPACFASYCDMQAKTVERSGFRLIANDMRQARDIALRPELWAKQS